MPITKGAKKAIRASARKRVFNLRRKTVLKDSVKEVRDLVSEKKVDDAEKNLAKAFQAIDKAAKRGIIKKNTAARKKSRLVKLIRKSK